MLNYLLAGTGSPAATVALAFAVSLFLAFKGRHYAMDDRRQVVYVIQTPDRQANPERVGQ